MTDKPIETNETFLLEQLQSGPRGFLARAITEVENEGPRTQTILDTIRPHLGGALVVGVTGAGGVGKSTLINALIKQYRDMDKTVAVVSVDPSSPLTGGALLGDRCRMVDNVQDGGVYIRSLATRGHLGGLCVGAHKAIDVLDAAGFAVILVETVGTGQSDVEISDFADVIIVVYAPGLGDEIQALKAGVIEIADILVVNKADLPFAGRTTGQLKQMTALGRTRVAPPVISTTATEGAGVGELVSLVDRFSEKRGSRLKRRA